MVSINSERQDIAIATVPFEDWVSRLSCDLNQEELARLRLAWDQAQSGYSQQCHDSGENDFRHALAVATLLAGLHLDAEAISAGLLYDLSTLNAFDPASLAADFGEAVSGLIDGAARVSLISKRHEPPGKQSAGQAEALRKMILTMARDIRVVLIALAERLVSMRELERQTIATQRQMAGQTLELYAPLANRLGLFQLKWQLEDLSLRVLEPERYQAIAQRLVAKRVDRERDIRNIQARLAEALKQSGIAAQVSGRPKHIYSIYRKMRQKDLGFDELADIRAVRVLVDTIAQCYAALGTIYELWQPIADEYDDYIAAPKANGYQSLHAAVIGPEGKSLEVQIRTQQMHQRAELGIAAHWRYKEGGWRDPSFDEKVAWLRELLQWAREEASEHAPIGHYKAELFEDRIYVLTPQGDVIDLPRGATPLDFAYHIHTQIGHHCRGAKVNAKMVPLTHALQTGDRVEVLTARQAEPSRDWLNPALGYLQTTRARSRVRRWFRAREFSRDVAEGRVILERELHRLGETRPVNFEHLAQRARFPKTEAFLAAIGRGEITSAYIATLVSKQSLAKELLQPGTAVARGSSPGTSGSEAIVIDGMSNLLTHLARCCRPAAGDRITGFITRNHGIVVHRYDCPNVSSLDQAASERLIDAMWGKTDNQRYAVAIQIRADEPQALLKELPTVLGSAQIKLLEVAPRTERQPRPAHLELTLEVQNIDQLSRVMHRIAAMRKVYRVRRVMHP